jgi:hypothetical protein
MPYQAHGLLRRSGRALQRSAVMGRIVPIRNGVVCRRMIEQGRRRRREEEL